jgi:hypothetical protein
MDLILDAAASAAILDCYLLLIAELSCAINKHRPPQDHVKPIYACKHTCAYMLLHMLVVHADLRPLPS